jgi:hypothetical protein
MRVRDAGVHDGDGDCVAAGRRVPGVGGGNLLETPELPPAVIVRSLGRQLADVVRFRVEDFRLALERLGSVLRRLSGRHREEREIRDAKIALDARAVLMGEGDTLTGVDARGEPNDQLTKGRRRSLGRRLAHSSGRSNRDHRSERCDDKQKKARRDAAAPDRPLHPHGGNVADPSAG